MELGGGEKWDVKVQTPASCGAQNPTAWLFPLLPSLPDDEGIFPSDIHPRSSHRNPVGGSGSSWKRDSGMYGSRLERPHTSVSDLTRSLNISLC